MRRGIAVVVGAAVLSAGAGCNRQRLEAGEARLVVADGGRALVTEAGREGRLVTAQRTLPRGARVKVLAGSATLALKNGSTAEVRKGTQLRLGRRLTLQSGHLLVTTSDAAPVDVEAAGSRATVLGAARFTRDLAVSAASYRGAVKLESAGRSLRVPALRQATIPSLGELADQPLPIVYDAADSWDRRFLGAAIDLGQELQAKSLGFTGSLRRKEGRTPGFYRLLLPALEKEPAFDASLLSAERPPGETLVGASIALVGHQAPFIERWRAVFAFRDQGAPWGLVALDQGVDRPASVVQTVDEAIGRAPLLFAAPVPNGPASAPRRRRVARPAASTSPRQPSAPASSPPAGASPPPPQTPSLLPTPTTLPVPTGPVVQPLIDTLTGLLPKR